MVRPAWSVTMRLVIPAVLPVTTTCRWSEMLTSAMAGLPTITSRAGALSPTRSDWSSGTLSVAASAAAGARARARARTAGRMPRRLRRNGQQRLKRPGLAAAVRRLPGHRPLEPALQRRVGVEQGFLERIGIDAFVIPEALDGGRQAVGRV